MVRDCLRFLYISPHIRLGTLTRWHVHPAQWLHRLPDHMSYEEGALCEPLTVALSGLEASGLRLGEPALVWYVPVNAYK